MPKTSLELRAWCRGWPFPLVAAAVLQALHPRVTTIEEEEVALAVARWLLEDDSSEPPPLNPLTIASIWYHLRRHVQ